MFRQIHQYIYKAFIFKNMSESDDIGVVERTVNADFRFELEFLFFFHNFLFVDEFSRKMSLCFLLSDLKNLCKTALNSTSTLPRKGPRTYCFCPEVLDCSMIKSPSI